MRKISIWIGIVCCSLALSCGNEDNDTVTKVQAASLNGQGNDGSDLCQSEGWYGDGVCDTFCVAQDSDCDQGCSTNDQCSEGQQCQNGSCEDIPSQGCTDDAQCAINATCLNGTCVDNVPSKVCGGFQGTTCEEDEYCAYETAAQCGAADQSGICVTKPVSAESCTNGNQPARPVCGCDGQTYDSPCLAGFAGTSVASIGACQQPKVCGGNAVNPNGCEADEYCFHSQMCGANDRPGICKAKNTNLDCAAQYLPVCGCDGQTYENACEANRAGVSISAEGECSVSCNADTDCKNSEQCVSGTCEAQKQCGGIAGLTCADYEYCSYEITAMCGAADQTGTCVPKPTPNLTCSAQHLPVCGCDGQTYGNACEANRAAVSISAEGECATQCAQDAQCSVGESCLNGICVQDSQPVSCGGIAGITCGADQYCAYDLAAMCGAADQTGVCVNKPVSAASCTNGNQPFRPVCGCDGQDYDSPCLAGFAGTSVASNGACP